jgi:hypothetical protein
MSNESIVLVLVWLTTLKMEATFSSETSVDFQRTTWLYIPEERTLHNHRSEPHILYFIIYFLTLRCVTISK